MKSPAGSRPLIATNSIAKIVRLTASGRQRKQVALDAMADIELEWQRHVGPDRLAALRATLQALR